MRCSNVNVEMFQCSPILGRTSNWDPKYTFSHNILYNLQGYLIGFEKKNKQNKTKQNKTKTNVVIN